jgi:hypothetical protein
VTRIDKRSNKNIIVVLKKGTKGKEKEEESHKEQCIMLYINSEISSSR